MANDTRPRGLYPITAPWGPPPLLYFTANTAVAIFRGQPVFINNSGQVQVVDVNTSNNQNVAIGVAWEFLSPTRDGLPTALTNLPNSVLGTSIGPFLPSSTDAVVGVTYDPHQLYIIEEDTAGTALTANSLGQAVAFTYQATTGNTTSGFANITTIRSTVLSSTGNLLQLVNVLNVINNDATVNTPGNFCKWIVRIQRHQFGNAVVSLPS